MVRSRVRRLLRAAARRARRLLDNREAQLTRDAQALLDAGVFDVEWYRVQRPEIAGDSLAAARDYVTYGRYFGFTPNPLFIPRLVNRKTWQTMRTEPLLRMVRARSVRQTHPLFNAKRYLLTHPDAAKHRGGPLGHFFENAGPDTVLPASLAVRSEVRWGRARELLLEAMTRYTEDQAKDLSEIDENWDPVRESEWRRTIGAPPRPTGGEPLVTVVMPVRNRADHVADAIKSIQAQSLKSWELVVVDDGSTDETPDIVGALAADDDRIRVVREAPSGVSRARNQALELARGRYVAFLDSDNEWTPDFLRLMTAAMVQGGHRVAHSAVEVHRDGDTSYRYEVGGIDELMVDNFIDLNAVVIERALVDEVGHFDETLRRMVDWELLIRLARVEQPATFPFIGVLYDDDREGHARITTTEVAGWREHILTKYLIDWDAEAARERVAGRVSIVMPTFRDWRMTERAVLAVLANSGEVDIEVVVVDNGSGPLAAQMLVALLTDLSSVKLVRNSKNAQFALGSNLGFVASTGEHVVFLNNDTEVQPGWLEPLLAELAKPDVVAVQPLLLYPDGTVQCAGTVFPERPGLPIHFLADHPPEDARALGTFATHAITAAAMLMTARTVCEHQGFDPLYTNGWEDVDLCLRAGRPDHRDFRVVTSSVVTHYEGKSPGRGDRTAPNRKLFEQRWRGRLPSGKEQLWADAGYQVAHEVPDTSPERPPGDIPALSRPMLVRPRGKAALPRLRWAIKIGAPASADGDLWGDTHFAAALARSLRALGQDVVVDRRDAHFRPTRYLDDVTLNLRGLEDVQVQPGAVNLMWVISHPALVSSAEVARYDHVFAASRTWSAHMSSVTGVTVTPLMQATDPALFNGDGVNGSAGAGALFVGNSRAVFRPIIRDAIAAGVDLRIHGAGWGEFLPDADFVKAPVANDTLGALYGSAGVVLNDHWADMAAEGFVSNRLFDAVASGGRVVSDHVAGLDDLFQGAVQVYRDVDDLRDLVGSGRDARFPGTQERLRIAEQVRREHSFDARARTLLDVALGYF